MGFFRRYKPTDYTAEECRDKMKGLEGEILWGSDIATNEQAAKVMEDWACFRELLARHEKQNKSPLDEKT